MPLAAAQCPACAAPLSETSVLAMAPVCDRCGSVITQTGGTLGQTAAFGINDPTVAQARKAADLRVLKEYLGRYSGVIEACREKLDWAADRYADPSKAPEPLPTKDVPKVLDGQVLAGFAAGVCALLLRYPLRWILSWANGWMKAHGDMGGKSFVDPFISVFAAFLWFFGNILYFLCVPISVVGLAYFSITLIYSVSRRHRITAENGSRPRENARRHEEFRSQRRLALNAGEKRKAAEDYRLRVQIREAEALRTTILSKIEIIERL